MTANVWGNGGQCEQVALGGAFLSPHCCACSCISFGIEDATGDVGKHVQGRIFASLGFEAVDERSQVGVKKGAMFVAVMNGRQVQNKVGDRVYGGLLAR